MFMRDGAPRATLTIQCRDRTGLVAAVSDLVFRQGGNILEADQHTEHVAGVFFMRLCWDAAASELDRDGMRAALDRLAGQFGFTFEISYSDHLPRMAVFVSKAPHCLHDLLLSRQLGDLPGEPVVVVSNHLDCESVARHFEVPFVHVPVAGDDVSAAEAKQVRLLEAYRADLIVLARYMRILSPAFVERLPARIINIHHSFLPAFVGPRPYHQAKERGVKIIGATAHYVTADLDQGPIIDQDVCPTSHRDEVEDLVRKGRELERRVLTRAVSLHLERRVLVWQNRTVVFR